MSSEEGNIQGNIREGNIQGRCTLLQVYPTAAHNRQAQIMVGFTCSDTTQSSMISCIGDLEKNHFASLEVICVHHAKSSV